MDVLRAMILQGITYQRIHARLGISFKAAYLREKAEPFQTDARKANRKHRVFQALLGWAIYRFVITLKSA